MVVGSHAGEGSPIPHGGGEGLRGERACVLYTHGGGGEGGEGEKKGGAAAAEVPKYDQCS